MAKRKQKGHKLHKFRDKLLLNQWLMSLFGIDPLAENIVNGKVVRPFHKLAEPIRDPRLEGLDKDNLHFFYHHLGDSPLFSYSGSPGVQTFAPKGLPSSIRPLSSRPFRRQAMPILRTATPRRSFLITPTGGFMRTVSARITRF